LLLFVENVARTQTSATIVSPDYVDGRGFRTGSILGPNVVHRGLGGVALFRGTAVALGTSGTTRMMIEVSMLRVVVG
jgi:hypothetical protein